MQRSLTEIYRFFLGYHFSVGVRVGVGIFAPLIIMLLCQVNFDYVLYFGFGSLIVSIADQIGPIRHKRNELLGVWLVTTGIAGIVAYIQPYPFWISAFIVLITFVGSLVGTFGKHGGPIGFSLIFATIISAKPVDSPLIYVGLTSLGGLSYAIYGLIVAYFSQKKMTRQALADTYFLLGKYLRALSSCYRQNNDLDESYQKLMDAQAALLEGQQRIRDLIYRKHFKEDFDYLKMANELLLLIDIQERLAMPFQDFRHFRTHFAHSDIQIFFRDLTIKAATHLEEISLNTLGGIKHLQRLGFKAELRALEYEIEIKKRENLQHTLPNIYHLLVSHYRKYWAISRQIEKLRKIQIDEINVGKEHIDGQFSKFVIHHPWTFKQLAAQFNVTSTMMRHSLRTSLAMALGLLILENTPFLNHGFWIAFTIVTLMSPGFSIMRQKTRDRMIGTVIGCIVGSVMISLQLSPLLMLSLLFVCVVLNNGLVILRHDLSVLFNTVYVLVLSNYQFPSSGLLLIGERILDTVFGAVIAIGFSFLLPSWERFEVNRLKLAVKKAICQLTASIDLVWFKKERDAVEYRLNRRAAQTSIAEVTHCFQRMQREPKAQQGNLEELSYFISQQQSVLSQLMQLAYGLSQFEQDPQDIAEFYELFLLVKLIIDYQQHHTSAPLLSAKEIKPLIWQLEEIIQFRE